MSFRIAIVCLNSQYVHSSLAPWCLLAGIRAYGEGIEARVIEGTVNERQEKLFERITEEPADLYAFCCYIWNIGIVASLCEALKRKMPKSEILWGGPEVGYTPKETLEEYPVVDYVLSGAGERSLAQLGTALSRSEALEAISGLTTRVFCTPPVPLWDPPSPYTEEYFAALKGRMAYLETMRGCPYSCAFCLSGIKEPLIFFPLERVKKELLLLCNSGTRTVKLVDRSFNADPKRAAQIVSFLLSSRKEGKIPPSVCVHFEIEAMSLTEELTELFCSAPAGFFRLEIGVQSLHPETLRAVHRSPFTQRLCSQIAALTRGGNLTVHADLILGLPYEGLEELRKSFNGLFALSPSEIQVGFLKLLKGTPMRKTEKYPCEYSPEPPYEVTATPWLSSEELLALKDFAHGGERIYNSNRFSLTLPYALSFFSTPFEFFWEFSRRELPSPVSLDVLTDALYSFLLARGAEEKKLRDLLVKDRLASCADRLSPLLKAADGERIHPKKRLEQAVGRPKGRRGAAVLYGEERIVFCDYDGGEFCRKDPCTGRYCLFTLPL